MPFLPPGMTGTSITLSREQALDVREKCLKSLKDRLIERANIIQVGCCQQHRRRRLAIRQSVWIMSVTKCLESLLLSVCSFTWPAC